jgi:membrane protease YdiL (CAAX protease family)
MLKKAFTVVEVFAVFFAGSFGARWLLRQMGIASSKEAIQASTADQFDAAAVAIPMSIRWAIVLSLAFLVGWVVARLRPRDYGFTLAGRSWSEHLSTGVVVYALGSLPVLILMLLRHYLHLPGGPKVWTAIEGATWNLDFWIFMLASSIVLPVLVEESFFRGYAQTRFSAAFGPRAAVFVIAVLFILAHTQYADGTFIGTGMMVLGVWWALLIGFARLRTGSLIAPMLAHSLSNVPLRPGVQIAMLFVIAVILIAGRSRARLALRTA